jgi:flagellar biosynthesis protein FlhA
MGIDNEYAQGAITEEERTAKMQELQQESDLYRQLEDASKFISGILKILITITVITALVGILISIVFHGETILDAAIMYVPLVISSGTICMLPLLLFSIAVGIVVTRTASPGDLGEQVEASDPMSIEFGFGLIPLVDKDKGADLMECIQRVRKETALNMGIVIPKIRIIDNMLLGTFEYSLKIYGEEKGKGVIDMGSNVVDPPSILVTHLAEIVKNHVAEFLDIQMMHSILEGMKKDYAFLVKEVFEILSPAQIQKVLQNLLREQVSIRNMVKILETLAEHGKASSDIEFLTEKIKQGLENK